MTPFKHLWDELKDVFSEAVREAKADVRQHQQDKQAEALIQFYRGLARPALLLHPGSESDPLSAPARLGGPAWFADDEEWPRDADGKALEFIAQFDFGRLPPLQGMPDRGVARFFVGTNDIWGVNFDAPDQSAARTLWHDGPQEGGRTEEPAPLADSDYSPFQKTDVRSNGLGFRLELIDDLPDFYSWQLQQRLDECTDDSNQQEIEDRIFDISESRQFGHRIGGHPAFTQYDFRQPGKFDDLDVLLLGLTSDDSIMWGDVGEAAFLIRRDDLNRRDFSRVAFYWDCH